MARILADLTVAVTDYEARWRCEAATPELGEANRRVESATAQLAFHIGGPMADEIRRALIMAAAANRSDSVALRALDQRVRGHFARDYDARYIAERIADTES